MATQTPPLDTDAAQSAVASWIAGINVVAQPLIEAAVGYRTQLESHGFSPTVAEILAYQHHAAAMNQLWRLYGLSTGVRL